MRISKNEKPLVTRGDQGLGTSESVGLFYEVDLQRRVSAGQRK
jgi:hypothetical protein